MMVFGQKQKKILGMYATQLISVESKIEGGIVNPETSQYEDSIIKIKWKYDIDRMSFDLENKYDKSIKINWSDASLINPDGSSSRVFHKGVKYNEREKEQSPTTVYKNSSLSDLLSPIDNVFYISGKYGGWQTRPIINAKLSVFSIYYSYDEEFTKKKIRVALPITIEDQVIEYLFEFNVVFIEKKK